jgi:hypothetical protein
MVQGWRREIIHVNRWINWDRGVGSGRCADMRRRKCKAHSNLRDSKWELFCCMTRISTCDKRDSIECHIFYFQRHEVKYADGTKTNRLVLPLKPKWHYMVEQNKMMGQDDTSPSPMWQKEDVSRGTPGRKRIRKPLWIPKMLGPGQIKWDREIGSRVAMDHYEQRSKEAAQIHTKWTVLPLAITE